VLWPDATPSDDEGPVRWISVPALRGERTLAWVSIGWDPRRVLTEAERDLLSSVAGLVAVTVENADLLERLRQEEESLEGALKKTLAAQEEERRRIARELHDDTSQILHALMMNIDLLETQGPGGEAVRAKLRAVKAMAEQAGRNLDKVMLDLRPALLDELGLVAALRWYVSQVRDAWGMPVGFEVANARRMPPHIEVATFRIAQEALSNAVKYSEASHIDVSVEIGEDTLVVRVIDDGKGFDVAEVATRARLGEAAGLLGMRERTELLGGRLSVDSRPGGGTSVKAEIPLPPAEGEEVHHGQDLGARR
jgi:signal transduction histidine kinase